MTDDALAAFREAVQLEPQNIDFKKQLASALERKQRSRARARSGRSSPRRRGQTGDKLLARETRTHIVTLLARSSTCSRGRSADLAARSSPRRPPDVEAGRTLAEAQIHQRKLADAETTLRRVIELAPGDSDSYLALERVLVQGNKIAGRDRGAREAPRRRPEAGARHLPAHGARTRCSSITTTTPSNTRRAPSS